MNKSIEPVPIAIIGAGRMGMLYGQIATELALTRLVALTSDHAEGTSRASAALGVPGYANCDYEQMLTDHRDIEAVIVSTPEWSHLEPVLGCLRAGKHVLVEKPLAVRSADAWQMVDEARRTGLQFMVCHSQRFNVRFALMRDAVRRGDVGAVVHMHARRNAPQVAVNRVLGKCELPYWLAPHDIDMMLWTVGSHAVSVQARSRTGQPGDVDFLAATIRFQNGVLGTLETSWCTPAVAGRPLSEIFTVHGDRGMVEVVGHEQGLAIYSGGEVSYPDTYHAPVIHGQTEGGYRSLIRHFAGVVRGLWPTVMTGEEAASVIDVAEALQESLSTGREATVVPPRR